MRKVHAMKRAITASILVAIPALGVGLAIAQPSAPGLSRAAARSQALERRDERIAAVQAVAPGPSGGDAFVTTLPHRNFREQPLPSPEELAAAAGCDSGTMLWRRDHGVETCAPLCDHDGDCADGERCRVVQTRATGPHALELAEEAQPGDVDDDDTVRLCDPSWEEPGPAVDAVP
ncbi:MAG: hypothetical protein A2138_22430 [Deltaproteobacteria bacterium RBG_16_71_12]|nr:MAG: hypothetical protein A2138_22430 [Deltaproteobacteria bacterium RBG_16_71_12]